MIQDYQDLILFVISANTSINNSTVEVESQLLTHALFFIPQPNTKMLIHVLNGLKQIAL